MKWRKGKPKQDDALYFVQRFGHRSDYGIGRYLKSDGLICGLNGEWSADPEKNWYAGPIKRPE